MRKNNVYVFGECDAFVHVYNDHCNWCIWVTGVWQNHQTTRKETADLIRKHKLHDTPIRKRFIPNSTGGE